MEEYTLYPPLEHFLSGVRGKHIGLLLNGQDHPFCNISANDMSHKPYCTYVCLWNLDTQTLR